MLKHMYYTHTKMYVIYYNNLKNHVTVSVSSFSSIYKVCMHDVSNVHVKSFYCQCVQSSQRMAY